MEKTVLHICESKLAKLKNLSFPIDHTKGIYKSWCLESEFYIFQVQNWPVCAKNQKENFEFWTKIKILSCCDLTIFFLHLFWNFSVHVLLYKSSSDYNSLLKFFESFKKINFKTPKKFQVSIIIQIGSIKQNVDRKNAKFGI